MKTDKVVKFSTKKFTVNQRYDATAIDQYELKVGPVVISVQSGYAVEMEVKIGNRKVFESKYDTRIANAALRVMWDLERREEDAYANEWLKATDGEWNHDPMDDYVGNYR